ncbi:hypothetical protein ACEZDB_10915 [Streptacidiphilus sp. N1-3]|uniref:Uncharacterized protein n=1 Tax=Streptacidiphilus alkalitolerans TaxID=3342712 RepID=A0ABV6WYN4_9ACTN
MSEQPVTAPPAPEKPVTAPPVTEPPAPAPPAPAPYGAATVWAVPPYLAPAPPSPRDRAWVRTALRWTTAAVVCAAVCVGTAVAVTAPRRTDLPGLRTPADGRYAFPRLTLPALPPKALTPSQGADATGDSDHAADLRKLLLPAPLGARTVKGFLPDPTGWYPAASYIKDMGGKPELTSEFSAFGLRHIAARAWVAADGTRTTVYLLQFRADVDAGTVFDGDSASTRPAGVTGLVEDGSIVFPGLVTGVRTEALARSAGHGGQAVRVGYVKVGEVEAVIVMSSPKAVPLVNFKQVVGLQGELLQG